MPIAPLPLPAIPPAPSRADPATFEERNDAAVEFQFNILPPWIEEQVETTYQNATESEESANRSQSQAIRAEAAADAASLAAGATEWVSGANYEVGDSVYSILNFQTYRRRVAGAGTTDPSLDPDNWQQVGGIMQGGSASLSRYDLSARVLTGTELELNLAECQIFRVGGTAPRIVSFVNPPGTNRPMVVIIHFVGAPASVTWPSEIEWDSTPPQFGPKLSRVILFWDGTRWTGFLGASR